MTAEVPPAVRRRSWRKNGWAVEVGTTVGLVRARQEDAWAVGFGWRLAGRFADVFAVFDGLGGHPNGDKASQQAAIGLQEAMRAAPGPDSLLAGLNQAVRESGGATTAVIAAFIHDGSAFLLHVGDSSAYALVGGKAKALAEHDTESDGSLNDYLGPYFRGGHATRIDSQPGGLLLCTDGVDPLLSESGLRQLLQAPIAAMAKAVDAAMTTVYAEGAPDNATLILCQRLPREPVQP